MPTASKLVAAICFAVLGYMMAEAYKQVLPPDAQLGTFSLICAGIGLLCGWLVAGRLSGKGYGKAWGLGVRTALTTVFWALLGFSIHEMILRSMKGRYGGSPMEALAGAISLVVENGQKALEQNFLLTLFIGGVIGGLLTEFAGRRWK
jgi:hypothetical protein